LCITKPGAAKRTLITKAPWKKPYALAGHLHRRKCGVDSIIQTIDEKKYARKFNPRRMESKWSETNKRRVIKVIREGRMIEAGMAKVTFDVNEVDRRTRKPKSKRPAVQMPENMERALKSRPGLWKAFQKVSPSYRRNYILWLSDAKKPETFERRFQILAEEVLAGKPTAMH
jgi:uncharacterized protein YdeI (YjbR/CyaY-like superfamily)